MKLILEQVSYEVEQRENTILVNGKEFPFTTTEDAPNTIILAGKKHTYFLHADHIVIDGISYSYQISDTEKTKKRKTSRSHIEDNNGTITALMPGLIVQILKNIGDTVQVGEPIIILEAMKMQNEIRSPKNGIIKECRVKQGESVEMRQVLASIE